MVKSFFKSLGMKFEDTGEFYTEGKHKGEPIQKALIKSKEDIPERVLEYFNYSNEFMCNLVGKENVIYSAIHFDENTPHMHFYFTPVVHEVKRKVFETDKDGHQILKLYITKDAIEKMIPIQKKDENGKNVYEIEYGNFLNSDQFWKEKGFKTSYAKIQDDYNKFINEKGFNLDRGEVGANKHHLTKAEKQLKDLQEQNKLLEIELSKNKALNNTELKYLDKISDVDTNPLLNPEKSKIIGYKEKDITNLYNYSKQITKDNLNKDKIIENQKLIIKEKDETINFQNTIISSLRNELTELKENIDTIINSVKNVVIDLYNALKRTLGFDVDKNQEYDSYSFKSLSKKINKKYEKDKSDDYEL